MDASSKPVPKKHPPMEIVKPWPNLVEESDDTVPNAKQTLKEIEPTQAIAWKKENRYDKI